MSGVDSFVGRRAEQATVTRLVRGHRLVTLVGPAGSGKTRLAVEVAARLPRETWFVDLAEISDGAMVAAAIARVLGVRQPLERALAARDLVVVLDNCEHIVDACASIVDSLLRACSAVTVLATSREALRVHGEQQFQVAEIRLEDAVRLFTDRARVADLDYQPDDQVAELCARLDRLPLAIELAARWVRVLSVADILGRLDDRLDLLAGGRRTASNRHRSLQAAISWSYDLLTPDERLAFTRLSVLVGPFTLEMAAAVGASPPKRMVHLLAALAEKSLLHAEPDRYRMLESIRAYGLEQLTDDPVERLVEWVHGKLAPHDDRFGAPPEVLRQLDAQWQSVLVALEWAAERDDPRHGLIAYALSTGWVVKGDLHEARRVLEDAPRHGHVLTQLAVVAAALGDYDTALAAADAVDTDAPGLLAAGLHGRGGALRYLGRVDEARAAYARCLDLLRGHDEPLALGTVLNNAAWAEIEWGAPDAAAALLDEGLVVVRPLGVPRKLAVMLHTVGTLALDLDDLDLAQDRFTESLRTCPDNPHQVPFSMEGLALVAVGRGALSWAARLAACAAGVRDRLGLVNEPAWQRRLDDALAAAPGVPASRVPLAEAAAYALAGPPPEPVGTGLTEQEIGMAALVADGMTNQQIARRLGVSAATVETHLRRARDKLGVRSRAQLAAWLATHQR